MKLCMIGTGYVGLVSGACFADAGNTVWCVDKDVDKVDRLRRHEIPIYEPGLEEIIERNEREQQLFFTTDLDGAFRQAEIAFITVDTPPDANGYADISNVLTVAKQLGQIISSPSVVVTKSTVSVGTTARVKAIISAEMEKRSLNPSSLIQVANNPEFLKEGSAVNDFMKPDRVIVGVESDRIAERLHKLYQPFMRRQDRFLKMDIPSSELCKYAANSMLATRISFMNELARLCEQVGANIGSIRDGLGRDPRIGPEFLYAGLGYGGSCFPKDMTALIKLGQEYATPLSIVEAAHRVNETHRAWFWQKIEKCFGGGRGLLGKRFALWGVAFKADTDDVRAAPALTFIASLLAAGAEVTAYDPAAMESGKRALGADGQRVRWRASSYDCLEGADALLVCTEWREFRSPDFQRMKSLLRRPLIFDGRLLYDRSELERLGFEYVTVGR